MNTISTTDSLFSYNDIATLVSEEKKNGNEGLMIRVTSRVRKIIGIEKGNLPSTIRTWIYRYCTESEEKPMKPLTGELNKPINLESLSKK